MQACHLRTFLCANAAPIKLRFDPIFIMQKMAPDTRTLTGAFSSLSHMGLWQWGLMQSHSIWIYEKLWALFEFSRHFECLCLNKPLRHIFRLRKSSGVRGRIKKLPCWGPHETGIKCIHFHNTHLFVSDSHVNVAPKTTMFVFAISRHNVITSETCCSFFDHLLLFWFKAPIYPITSWTYITDVNWFVDSYAKCASFVNQATTKNNNHKK